MIVIILGIGLSALLPILGVAGLARETAESFEEVYRYEAYASHIVKGTKAASEELEETIDTLDTILKELRNIGYIRDIEPIVIIPISTKQISIPGLLVVSPRITEMCMYAHSIRHLLNISGTKRCDPSVIAFLRRLAVLIPMIRSYAVSYREIYAGLIPIPMLSVDFDLVIAVPMDRWKDVELLLDRLGAMIASGRVVDALIDIEPNVYLVPASFAGSFHKLEDVVKHIDNVLTRSISRTDAVYEVETTSAFRYLPSLEGLSITVRIAIGFLAISSLIIVAIVARPAVESSILSMRRTIALMRTRGVPVKKLYLMIASSMGIAGFLGLVGTLVAVIVLSKLYGLQPTDVIDPIGIGMIVVLATILILIVVKSVRRIVEGIPPTEVSRFRMLPEALLGWERMGVAGWVSLALGLYIVAKNLARFSAIKYLAESPPRSLVLMVILVIAALIEAMFQPFAPILFAYGVSKLIRVYGHRLLSLLERLGSSLAFVSRGLLLATRRRALHIVALLVFAISTVSTTPIFLALEKSIHVAEEAVLPTELVGIKHLDNVSRAVEDLEALAPSCIAYAILGLPAYEGYDHLTLRVVANTTSIRIEMPTTIVVVANSSLLSRVIDRFGWIYNISLNKLKQALVYGHAIDLGLPEDIASSRTVSLVLASWSRPNITIRRVYNLDLVDKARMLPGIAVSELRNGIALGAWILREIPNNISLCITEIALCPQSKELLLKSLEFHVYTRSEFISSINIPLMEAVTKGLSTCTELSSIPLLGMTIALAVTISISTIAEIRKVFALLRVRGCGLLKALEVSSIQWIFVAALGVGLGLLFGYAQLEAFKGGSLFTIGFMNVMQSIPIPTPIGVARVPLDIVFSRLATMTLDVLATCLAMFLAISFTPLIVVYTVYRGVARERLVG